MGLWPFGPLGPPLQLGLGPGRASLLAFRSPLLSGCPPFPPGAGLEPLGPGEALFPCPCQARRDLSSPEPQMTPVTAGSALARHAPGAIWGRAYVIWCAIFSVHSHLEFLRSRHILHAGGLRTQNRPNEGHAMLPSDALRYTRFRGNEVFLRSRPPHFWAEWTMPYRRRMAVVGPLYRALPLHTTHAARSAHLVGANRLLSAATW